MGMPAPMPRLRGRQAEVAALRGAVDLAASGRPTIMLAAEVTRQRGSEAAVGADVGA